MSTHEMFAATIERLTEYGPGAIRTLPQELATTERFYDAMGFLGVKDRVYLKAASMRLFDIATELSPNGDGGTITLAMDLQQFANETAAV